MKIHRNESQHIYIAMLEVPWLQEVDWKDWMDASMALPEGHSTIACEVPAEETIDKLANLKHSKLSEVRRLHRDVLKKLLIEISNCSSN